MRVYFKNLSVECKGSGRSPRAEKLPAAKLPTAHCPLPTLPRSGFTLVEMLVVVALTVLLMSIVAEVFVLASGTLNTLRGISDTNQRIRNIESVIRLDLANRTIREVQPPVQPMTGIDGKLGTRDDWAYPLGIDPSQNQGYLELTEHSPADEQGEDADDWIAFTVRLREPSKAFLAGVGAAYFGRALRGSEPDLAFPGSGAVADGLAGSMEAEVIYYLRRGTLYRRQLLVGVAQPSPSQVLTNLLNSRSWYELFDISARPPLVAGDPPIVNTLGDLTYRSARFMHLLPAAYTAGLGGFPTLEAGLKVDSPGDGNFPFLPVLQYFESGNSSRFHDARTPGALNQYADQLDHNHNYPLAPGTMRDPEDWFGFPTVRETSARAAGWHFNYPNDPASTVWGDYFVNGRNLNFQSLNDNATRVAEDALLTNVLSFDIKVWDPDAIPNPNGTGPPTGAWVDLGKLWPGVATPTLISPSVNAPGPRPSEGTPIGLPGQLPPRRFTWPPASDPTAWFGADGKPGRAGFDDDGDGVVDNMSEFAWPGTDDVRPYGRGFGEPFGFDSNIEDANRNLLLDLGEDKNGNGKLDSYAIPPRNYGTDGRPGVANVDDDGNGIIDDESEFGWPGSDDDATTAGNPPLGMLRAPLPLARTYDTWCTAYTKPTQQGVIPVAPPYIVPLRGIQIKIRFVDPATRLTREITIVQELLP